MDRAALLRNSAKRLMEAALNAADQKATEIKRVASAAGRLNGGSTNADIEAAYLDHFRDGSVAVLDKIQLEDREGALETAETFKKEIFEPSQHSFSASCSVAVLGKRPEPGATFVLNSTSTAWHKHRDDIAQKLRRIQDNVVEEFQLAVTRHSKETRQPIHAAAFVDPARIEELRAKTSVAWDFKRLIALCEEINTSWLYGSHHSVAMLTRAILDHVPPVFTQPNFAGVANQYAGGKSFSDVMKQLDKTSKAIADGHLHNQIRSREVLPTATQVDCRQGVDALLAELVRITA